MLCLCPHCKLVYKVSDEQLNKALGAVRCSGCMKIFNALNHKLDREQLSKYKHQLHNLHVYDDELSASGILQVETDFFIGQENNQFDKSLGIKPKNSYNLHQNKSAQKKPIQKRQSLFVELKNKLSVIYFAFGALVILTLAVFAFKFFFATQAENTGFKIENILLLPADNLKEFKVEFTIENLNLKATYMPELEIEMQDLSKNIIKRQIIDESFFGGNLKLLPSKQERKISLTLIRPKKLVAGVEIKLVKKTPD